MTVIAPEIPNIPELDLGPAYPPGTPTPEPPIEIFAHDAHLTWNTVFGAVKGFAAKQFSKHPIGAAGLWTELKPAVETYVGTVIKVLGGVINDVSTYAQEAAQALGDATQLGLDYTAEVAGVLDRAVYVTLSDLNHIFNDWIPTLTDGIAHAERAGEDAARATGQQVQAWALSEIKNPLTDEIKYATLSGQAYTDRAIGHLSDSLLGVIHDDNALLKAATAAVAVSAAKALDWQDDCGEPMCEVMGPNTDLGKLLKLFQYAADLALVAEFLGLNKDGAEEQAKKVVGFMGDMIRDFDGFVTGGATVGSFLEKVAASATGL